MRYTTVVLTTFLMWTTTVWADMGFDEKYERDYNVHRAVSALESLGYRPVAPVSAHELADPAKREAWIREKNMVVFSLRSEQHRETPVDIFVSEPFVFDIEYDRALVGDILPGVPARFICLETLIRMKEQTGREKDREDVRQLKFFLEKPDEQA